MTDTRVLTDREIWIAANQTIKAHGDEAEIQAALKAEHFLKGGDLEGQRTWVRIGKAILELNNNTPPGSLN